MTDLPDSGADLVPKWTGLRATDLRVTDPPVNGTVRVLKGAPVVLRGPMETALPINGGIDPRKATVLLKVNGTVHAQAAHQVALAGRLVLMATGLRVNGMVLVQAAVQVAPAMVLVPVVPATVRVQVDPVTVRDQVAPVMVLGPADPAARLLSIWPRVPSRRSSAPRKKKLISRKRKNFSTRPTKPRREPRPRPTRFPRKWRSWRLSP